MGPKPRKGGKKGRKRKKKADKVPKLTRTEYLNKIAGRNAVLAQARRELKAIEDTYYETEKKHEEAQGDKADILKFLEHELEENEDEIAEFNEKIALYLKEIKKNDNHYDAIISKLGKEYKDKEALLQNQVQLVRAKIMTLEDTKIQIKEHKTQKKMLMERLRETTARHEEEIYEAEKSVITKQDTMQTEMDAHLTTLAADFRQATDIAIGETSNKMIKDNINLGNTLTCMQEILEKARNSFLKMQALEKRYRHDAEILQEEHFTAMDAYLKRANQVEILIKNQEELREKIRSCQKLIKDNRRLQRQFTEKECIWKDKVDELEELQKVLKDAEENFDAVKNNFTNVGKNVFKLESILFETAKKVKDAIDVEFQEIIGEEKEEEGVTELEKEENLKDLKYRKREQIITEVIEKLNTGLQVETESQLYTPSTESYRVTMKESIFSQIKSGFPV